MSPTYSRLPKDYAPFSPFGDGGMLFHTGRLFACVHFDLYPDMLCVANALSGGLAPIGAVIATAPIATSMEENDGSFYSTYGWHPRSVAAAIATLRDLRANRPRLLARLALELYYSGDPNRRQALSEQTVELARRLGDPRTLAVCLDARHYALWRPETVDARLEVAAELRRVAEQTGYAEL